MKILITLLLFFSSLCPVCEALLPHPNNHQEKKERDLSVLKFDLDRKIDTLGVEVYRNINVEFYGEPEEVHAFRDELKVRLKDDQDLEVIFDIAEEYQMEVLERYREDTPSFRLRFIQGQEHLPFEEVWTKLFYHDHRVESVCPNFAFELF